MLLGARMCVRVCACVHQLAYRVGDLAGLLIGPGLDLAGEGTVKITTGKPKQRAGFVCFSRGKCKSLGVRKALVLILPLMIRLVMPPFIRHALS